MKCILAHLEVSQSVQSILRCSWLAAARFSSYVEGVHMRPGQPDVIAAGADGFVAAAPDLVAGFEREARDRADRARDAFQTFMTEHKLARPSETSAGQCSADWRIVTSSGQSAIGSVGRTFDLLVLGRPVRDSVTPSMTALESALFESGRPLIVAPPVPPEKIGDNIAIAWNCSTETARTVAFAMPFLVGAETVSILQTDRGVVSGPSSAELARSLAHHGINACCVDIRVGDKNVGEAILDEARNQGADLLVKGAFTQSRLRQMIFGGATSQILASAELPVFMAN